MSFVDYSIHEGGYAAYLFNFVGINCSLHGNTSFLKVHIQFYVSKSIIIIFTIVHREV